MLVSVNFKYSRGSAKISSEDAFIQATQKHQTKNGTELSLTDAETAQGNIQDPIEISKGWVVFKKIKSSPSLGYEIS